MRVDLALEIGSVNETVEVKSTGPLLQTEQPNVGGIVDRNFVDNLPADIPITRNQQSQAWFNPWLAARIRFKPDARLRKQCRIIKPN